MSEAQKEILKMLSNQEISVDEAERLLKALKAGEKLVEESGSRIGGGVRSISSVLETLGDTLSNIGPMVKTAVEDVVSGITNEEMGDVNEEELEDVCAVDGKFKIEDGKQLIIKNTRSGSRSGGNLVLHGVDEDFLTVSDDEAKGVQIQQSSTHFVIKWSEGPLQVEVPRTVNVLKAKTKGGDISTIDVGCEMNVKTLGGDLDIKQVKRSFTAKTMGGNINLVISKGWKGNGQAHTMGGNIDMFIPETVSTKVKASTMGGTISVDKDVDQKESKKFFHGNSIKLKLGEEDTGSFISIKTMGGNIDLRKE